MDVRSSSTKSGMVQVAVEGKNSSSLEEPEEDNKIHPLYASWVLNLSL